MQIYYLENKIELKESFLEKEFLSESWNSVWEDYNSWLSKFRFNLTPSKKTIIKDLEWQGMSGWWVSNLIQKDTEINNKWLKRIYILYLLKTTKKKIRVVTDDKLLIKSIKKNFRLVDVELLSNEIISFKKLLKSYFPITFLYLKVIKIFIYDLLKIIFLKLIQNNNTINNDFSGTYFFRTLYPANLTIIDNKLFDRHYSKTIFEQNNIRKIAFLVYLKNYNKYSFNSLLKLILELIQLRKHKSEEIIYPEAFLSFYDLLRINFSSIRQLKKLLRYADNESFKNYFTINNINCFEILFNEFIDTYGGLYQYSMSHGMSLGKLLKKIKSPKAIVTYGEFFVQSRAFYYFGKKYSKNTIYICIQHSYNCKNYCAPYNTSDEFSVSNWLEDNHFSPMPDYFCAQGLQYINILQEFYPKNKIRLIGNLKFDTYFDKIRKFNSNLTLNKKENIF